MKKGLLFVVAGLLLLAGELACTSPTGGVPFASSFPNDPGCTHVGNNSYNENHSNEIVPIGKMHFLEFTLPGGKNATSLGVMFAGPVSGMVMLGLYDEVSPGVPGSVLASGTVPALFNDWSILSFSPVTIAAGKYMLALQTQDALAVRSGDAVPTGQSVANTYGSFPTNPGSGTYFTTYMPYQYVTLCP